MKVDERNRSARARVLLLATGQWNSTARQAMALAELGCDVRLMAARSHPAMTTSAVRARYRYSPLRPLHSMRAAILAADPVCVVPVDELAVLHLEELYGSDENLRPLLQRSLGGAEVFRAARSRMKLMTLAQAEGVGVPATRSIDLAGDLEDAANVLGLPLVMKADSTSGGRGVRIVPSVAAGFEALQELRRPPTLPESVWRSLKWREHVHFRQWALRRRRGVTAQRFLSGAEMTAMAVAVAGKVLAVVCLEVVKTWALRGPASVVRVVEDEVMERAVRAVVRKVGSSGLCGFDFMVDEKGVPLLIEMNPRPTQLAHVALGPGRDLIAAYVRSVVGMEVADRPSVLRGDVIALFPQELQRDVASTWTAKGYHDVPWGEKRFVERVLRPLPDVIRCDERWKG